MRTSHAALAALVAACSGKSSVEPPGPPSENPIDVAIWPRLLADGTTDLPAASTDELCRRMAIDLIGAAPTRDERATLCANKTPEAMARAFLASPRFKLVERRFWIRRLGADPTEVLADHLADADRLFDAAADGTLGYDDLVARLLAHPIMTINRPIAAGDDPRPTIAKIFQLFLGRAPSQDESADYANLLRPWHRRSEDRYDKGYGYYVPLAILDPHACDDAVLGAAACTSTLLGAPTTMAPQIAPLVPAGYSQTDARFFYYELVHADVPAALQAELEKPGRLLATRAELWDEAADLALARFLGWWRSSANVPETVLPEVRRALAEWFRAQPTHDLRELYVVVMTSLLYATTNAFDAVDDRPPWTSGPTKLLEPEQLLDSVARALDHEIGFCDPHTNEPVGRNFFWPERLRVPQPPDYYGFRYDYYYSVGQALGGCIGAVQPPQSPGLPALLEHIGVGVTLCDDPSKLVPDGIDPGDRSASALAATATDLFERFASRSPDAAETAALQAAATSCGADAACGTARQLAQQVCGSLIRSATELYQ